MTLVNKDTKLYEVVIQEPTIITVLSRFGITLGVGDKSVKQICEERNLDVNFFLSILNTFINPDYFPENELKAFNISEIIAYMRKTNEYYCQFLIPNIEQHFNLLIMRSASGSSNLELMRKFFLEVKSELLSRINKDVANEYDNSSNEAIEDKLSDLINMFVIHLAGSYNQNLCQAVLMAIINLKKDICQNNRIRAKILMPVYQALPSKQSN